MNLLPVKDFLELLRHSNLLASEQLAALEREVDSGAAATPPKNQPRFSSKQLADQLVKRGWLTRWQADTLLAGHKTFFFGKYRLLERIGTGGMGSVYKARHEHLGRIVALKIMSRAVVKDERAVARFRNEIRAVAALDHPNIVAAYDADCVDSTHFLVMEFVPGHDLGWYVQTQGKLPIGWTCECIRQVALGLKHAHAQGMVHRDIKPTNLLVAEDPETGAPLVKLLDLGLARFADEAELPALASSISRRTDPALTQAGQVLGTPDYMSPEQSLDTRNADIRSDIFSLGCTLFRLLTAEMAFPGESVAQKLRARQQGQSRDLLALRPEIPAELAAIIARMMAVAPSERYQSAAEVAAVLAPFAVVAPLSPTRPAKPAAPDGPVTLAPVDSVELDQLFAHLATHAADDTPARDQSPSRAWILPHVSRRIWLSTGATAAALIIMLGLWRWLSEAVLIVELPVAERRGAVLTINDEPQTFGDNEALHVAGRPGKWTVRLTRPGYVPILESFELAGGEYRQWSPVWKPTEKLQRTTRLADLQKRAALEQESDPTADSLALLRRELVAFRAHAAGTDEGAAASQLLARLPSGLDALPLAPGSHNVTVPSPAVVNVLGAGRLRFWNRVVSISLSRSGKLVAAAGADGTVRIFDRHSGQQRHLLPVGTGVERVAFGPTDDVLAVVASDRDVALWNPSTGSLRGTLEDARAPFAYSPDGVHIATAAIQAGLRVWNLGDGRLEKSHAGGRWATRWLAFSPDSRRLASLGANEALAIWDLASGQQTVFEKAGRACLNGDWTVLAAEKSPGEIELRDATSGESIRQLKRAGEPLAFSTDGRRLITRTRAKDKTQIHVWNVSDGASFPTILDVTEPWALSSDGNWLAVVNESARTLRFCDLASRERSEATVECDPVSTLAFAPGEAILVSGGENGRLRFWDAQQAREQTPGEPDSDILAFAPDGNSLAMRRGDRIEFLDVTARRPARSLEGTAEDINELAVSPDGSRIVGYGIRGSDQVSMRSWDVISGSQAPHRFELSGPVRALAFAADGKTMATAGDSPLVFLWNFAEQQSIGSTDKFGGPVTALAFDPHGRWLAGCREQSVFLLEGDPWKSTRRRELELPKGLTNVRFLQLEPGATGERLAAVTSAGLFVWKVQTGQRHRLALPGEAQPRCVAFNPTGDRLAVGGDSGTVWIWHTESGQLPEEKPASEFAIGPPGGVIRKVLWSPDGRHLLTHNGDGTVYVLQLASATRRPEE